MANPQSLAQRTAKHADRLGWLKAQPMLLACLPGANDDVTDISSQVLDDAVRQMKFLKLYAPSSGPDATRWGIRLLVSEIRGQLVTGQDPRYRHRLRR